MILCIDCSSAGLRCHQSRSYIQLVVGLGFQPEPQLSSPPRGLPRWLAWYLMAWWSEGSKREVETASPIQA